MFNFLWGFLWHPLSYITPLVSHLNQWVYLILFIWIFLETAFLVFSFLPGQSVLFLTGTISASTTSNLNIFLLIITFIIAASSGAILKYWYGVNIDSKNQLARKINASEQMSQTQAAFDQNTKKTLLLSRFIPFIGLFIPIVAGATGMNWYRFNKLNFTGVLLWVSTCCFSGYFFGRTTFVKQYFSFIFILLIIVPFSIGKIWKIIKKRVEG